MPTKKTILIISVVLLLLFFVIYIYTQINSVSEDPVNQAILNSMGEVPAENDAVKEVDKKHKKKSSMNPLRIAVSVIGPIVFLLIYFVRRTYKKSKVQANTDSLTEILKRSGADVSAELKDMGLDPVEFRKNIEQEIEKQKITEDNLQKKLEDPDVKKSIDDELQKYKDKLELEKNTHNEELKKNDIDNDEKTKLEKQITEIEEKLGKANINNNDIEFKKSIVEYINKASENKIIENELRAVKNKLQNRAKFSTEGRMSFAKNVKNAFVDTVTFGRFKKSIDEKITHTDKAIEKVIEAKPKPKLVL